MRRVLLVDDSPTVRHELHILVESEDEYRVCEEATDGADAIEKFSLASPDITIMDFNMPGMNGLDSARRILADHPEALVLMVTVFTSPVLMQAAKEAGIRGFCSKSNIGCVFDAMQALLSGRTYYKSDA